LFTIPHRKLVKKYPALLHLFNQEVLAPVRNFLIQIPTFFAALTGCCKKQFDGAEILTIITMHIGFRNNKSTV
jgi:hypothetical protein